MGIVRNDKSVLLDPLSIEDGRNWAVTTFLTQGNLQPWTNSIEKISLILFNPSMLSERGRLNMSHDKISNFEFTVQGKAHIFHE